jgi:hypothetical protein
LLGQPSSITQFISHHEDQKLLEVWGFACRYRLESAVKGVEAEMQSRGRRITGAKRKHGEEYQLELNEAVRYVSSLPSSSADVGLSSLMRLLHRTTQSWAKLATELRARIDSRSFCIRIWAQTLDQYKVKASNLESILDELSKVVHDLGPM